LLPAWKTESLWFKWQASILPRIKATRQCLHSFEAVIVQYLRHTGAGCLVRSSAICYHELVAWNIGEMPLDLVGRHSDGARQFCTGFTPSLRITSIDKEHIFPLVDSSFEICNIYSNGSHITTFQVKNINRLGQKCGLGVTVVTRGGDFGPKKRNRAALNRS